MLAEARLLFQKHLAVVTLVAETRHWRQSLGLRLYFLAPVTRPRAAGVRYYLTRSRLQAKVAKVSVQGCVLSRSERNLARGLTSNLAVLGGYNEPDFQWFLSV